MARTVDVGKFQRMQRENSRGPSHVALGESEALGDAAQNGQAVGAVDPLTGGLVDATDSRPPEFRNPPLTVAQQLQALVLQDDISGMPLGQVVGLVRQAVGNAHVNALESEIRDEAERRRAARQVEESISDLLHGDEESDYPTVSDLPCDRCGGEVVLRTAAEDRRLASRVAEGIEIEVICDTCAVAEEPIAPRPEDQAAVEYDVAPDGTVEAVRAAEMSPDRGPDVGTKVHTVTDDEPRFSGGGAEDGQQQPLFLVPNDSAFAGRLYREAPELANIAEALIEEHGFLDQLANCDIRWYWKRKTGVSKGRVKIGFMKRASDLLGHFSGADFIGWLSATTARDGKFTDTQVEAAVFHQLLHIDSDDKGNWIFVPHDFEGFAQEVRHFGTWTEGLKLGGSAFVAAQQMGLFDATDEDDEDLDEEDADDEQAEIATGLADVQPAPWERYRTTESPTEDAPADPDQPFPDEGEEISAAPGEASDEDPLADHDL